MSAARTPLFRGFANRRQNEATGSDTPSTLDQLQQRFEHVRNLVDVNNQVLALIGDMEEKALGDFLFDNAYIVRQLDRLSDVMQHLLAEYHALDGEGVDTLRVNQDLQLTVRNLLPWSSPSYRERVTLPLQSASNEHQADVGGKSLALSDLLRHGHPVPTGFTITSHAYQQTITTALGNTSLTSLLEGSESDSLDQLEQRCAGIRDRLAAARIPAEIETGILTAFDEQFAPNDRVVMRSSAIGEDSQLSFAGQYNSVLDVGRDELLDAYRQVIASKFQANTLYYMISHGIPVADMPVAVICQAFVAAEVSGVCYTRDPVRPDTAVVVIHAAPGLGHNVVEGRVMPDVYRVDGEQNRILDRELADRSDVTQPANGCLSDELVLDLTRKALAIEQTAGQPQDIEFAVDTAGQLAIVQARRLETICVRASYAMPDLQGHLVLASGGKTACPGAGHGPAVHVLDPSKPAEIPHDAVLITRSPDPRLSVYLPRISALVTEVGSTASHLATLAREKRVPALFGLGGARHRLPEDETVTVDASGMKVYAGPLPELVHARRADYETLTDTAIFELLGRILQYISPLRLLNPLDEAFQAQNCSTVHDIVRFVHQKGMEALFAPTGGAARGKQQGAVLKTALPLTVHLLRLDDTAGRKGKTTIPETAIPCMPMQQFWNGILSVGWPGVMPANPSRTSMKSYELDTSVHRRQFSQLSFAVIRPDYMLFNLRLGYHFTSVEALVGDDVAQNFIRIHYKGGGAAGERRQRRIALVEELLDRMNFGHHAISDFVVASADHLDPRQARDDLVKVGQLFMHTKQLDMALSNERITRWYTEDIARSLGLPHSRARL